MLYSPPFDPGPEEAWERKGHMPRNSGKNKSAGKQSGNAGKPKKSGGSTGKPAFAFADPQVSADNFTSFSKVDVKADTALKANQIIEAHKIVVIINSGFDNA